MNKSMNQQIIDLIDEKEFITIGDLSRHFNRHPLTLAVFEDMLADGQIRQVVADKNLGTYKYCLPA
jgi:hypothetical protein